MSIYRITCSGLNCTTSLASSFILSFVSKFINYLSAKPFQHLLLPFDTEEPTDEIHFLFYDAKSGWTVNRKIELVQPKNKDIVTFEITQPYKRYSHAEIQDHVFLPI